MAILGAGPATVQQQLVRQRTSQTQTEGSRWLLGVGAEPGQVRRAVARELAGGRWAWVHSVAAGRQRRAAPVEVLLWVDEVVRTVQAPVADDLVRAHALGSQPLEGLPFRVVVAPDAVVLRWQRSLGGDRDAELLLQRLVVAGLRRRTSSCETGSRRQDP